jgi:hypothetical protein
MKKMLALALIAVLVMTLLPLTAFAAADETMTVGAGEAYTTIQEAVDAALSSAEAGTKTIMIKAGTYNETVEILQKPGINIVLQGENGTVFKGNIVIDGDGRAFDSNTLTIKNITFDKSGAMLTDHIYIIDTDTVPNRTTSEKVYAHNVTIEDCTFVGDDSGEYTYAIQAGKSGGNTAFNTVIRNCTFSNVGCAIQARSNGLTLENVTATNVRAGINSLNSSNITLKNVKIYASEYALRVGEDSGDAVLQSFSIEGCVLSSGSTDPTKSAIVLRASTQGDINIESSDIYGYVYNASDDVTVTTNDVYWGTSDPFTGFSEGQLIRNNDAQTPHWLDSEVKAKADIAYTIVITPTVDFGTIDRSMGTLKKDFIVTVEDALIEDDARITVQNTTKDMFMRDKDGVGNETLAFTLEQPNGLFTFTQEDLADGKESINSKVKCDTTKLRAAGSYKGYMLFTVSYVAP